MIPYALARDVSKSRRPPRQRVRTTIQRDDVARVDMALDEEGDLELCTWYREGNRWECATALPTVAPVRAFMAGLIELGTLGIGPRDVPRLVAALAISGVPGSDRLARLLREGAQDVLAKAPPTGSNLDAARAVGGQ